MKFRKSLIAILIAILSLATMAFAGCALTVSSDSENDASEVESPSGSEETPITYEITVNGGGEVAHNGTAQITAYVDGADDAEFAFSSSNESVVTVDGDGLATGHAAGSAIITVTASSEAKGFNDLTGEVEITVKHAFGEWTYVTAPTLESAGEAKRTCEYDGEEETAVAPALSDESWSLDEEISFEPTFFATGEYVFVHPIYPTVHFSVDKLEMPLFAGKNCTITALYGNSGNITMYRLSDIAISDMTDDFTCEISYIYDEATIVDKWGEGAVMSYNAPVADSFVVTFGDDEFLAYYDIETGFIVSYESNHLIVIMPTDLENGKSSDYLDSKRRNGDYAFVAFDGGEGYFVEYKDDDGKTHTIYADADSVNFGAKLDFDGEKHIADLNDCNFIDVLYDDEVIGSFGKKDGKFIALDGFQGNYDLSFVGEGECDLDAAFLNGMGKITVYNDGEAYANGIYELKSDDDDYLADVYLSDAATYLRLIRIEDETAVVSYPLATLSFHANGGEMTLTEQSVNINVISALEKPSKDGYEFGGWYEDSDLTSYVGDKIIVTEEGATVDLYAKYLVKVTLDVYFEVDNGEEEPNVYKDSQIEVVETKDLYAELVRTTGYRENYYDLDLYYAFVAFVYGDEEIAEGDIAVTTEMESITVKWLFTPPYTGSYYGTEIWSASSGNNSKNTLSITNAGEISGIIKGFVVNYDAESQKIYWAKTQDAEEPFGYFFFDPESGVIAGKYSGMETDMGYDVYVVSKYNSEVNYKFASAYAVYSPAVGDVSANYLAHFLTVPTLNGDNKDILVYVNHIYSDITIADTNGNEYSTSTIKNAKTLLVYDNDSGNVVYKAATSANSFDKGNGSSTMLLLDTYYGTYSNEKGENVVIDGVGGITYNGKTGTYTLAESEDYTFDVYLNNSTEYYRLTIDENYTYTSMEKVMVTVAFDTNSETTGVSVDALYTNMNIEISLPTVDDTSDFVFRGWYSDAEFETKLGGGGDAYIPTSNANVYAKFLERVDITLNFNGGEGSEEDITVYGKGETTVVGTPKLTGQKFIGWYTTEDFAEGSEWTAGEAIFEDVELFAKWQEAPAFYHTYGNVMVYGTTGLGGVSTTYSYSSSGAVIDVSPEGTAVATAYPFRGNVSVYYTDEESGQLMVKVEGSYSSSYFKGYIHKPSGLIVMAYSAKNTEEEAMQAQLGEVTLLSPFETGSLTSHVSSSYWNQGYTRTIQYTYEDSVYGILVYEGTVYFDVEFVDADGIAIDAKDCYTAPYINVLDADEETVVELYHLKFDVTINYGENSGIESVAYSAQDGEVLTESDYKPTGLNAEGKAFSHWYLDDINEHYDFASPIKGDITINVAWKDAVAQYGDWKGWNFYGTNPGSASLSDSYAFSIDPDGTFYKGLGSKFSGYSLVHPEVTDGAVNITNGSNTYYMYYNKEAGVLWSQYNGNANGVGTDTALFILQKNYKSATYAGKAWNGHYFGFVNIVYTDDSSKTIMCYNDCIYVVTLPDGTSLTDARDNDVTLYNADGTQIFCIKDGETILFNDGLAGTYTNGDNTLIMDGYGTMTLNDTEYSYNKISDNVVSYVFEELYHEITVNGNAFTDEAVYCTISFNLGEVDGSVEEITANKTSSIALPGADGGDLIFSGWFEDEELTVAAGVEGNSYTVNSDTVLYAKWSTEAYAIATSSLYPWTYDEESTEWTCGNHNVNSSESTITITAYAAITVEFDYACDSENAERWDYFSITLNNSEPLKAGGKIGVLNYQAHSVTMAAGDVLVLKYQKDSSSHSNMDIAKIKNFKINGELIVEI